MNIENKRLGDIATYINGYAFKPEQWDTNGKPIIRIQNLNNNLAEFNYYNGDINEKYIVNKGDILISWSASIGVYEWQNEEALLNQHIFKVDFNKIDINNFAPQNGPGARCLWALTETGLENSPILEGNKPSASVRLSQILLLENSPILEGNKPRRMLPSLLHGLS